MICVNSFPDRLTRARNTSEIVSCPGVNFKLEAMFTSSSTSYYFTMPVQFGQEGELPLHNKVPGSGADGHKENRAYSHLTNANKTNQPITACGRKLYRSGGPASPSCKFSFIAVALRLPLNTVCYRPYFGRVHATAFWLWPLRREKSPLPPH